MLYQQMKGIQKIIAKIESIYRKDETSFHIVLVPIVPVLPVFSLSVLHLNVDGLFSVLSTDRTGVRNIPLDATVVSAMLSLLLSRTGCTPFLGDSEVLFGQSPSYRSGTDTVFVHFCSPTGN